MAAETFSLTSEEGLPIRGDVDAPVARANAVPDGFAPVEPRAVTARFRRRETGTYGEAPYVEEWKPLPGQINRRTTTFQPVANPALDESRFRFVPPSQ